MFVFTLCDLVNQWRVLSNVERGRVQKTKIQPVTTTWYMIDRNVHKRGNSLAEIRRLLCAYQELYA